MELCELANQTLAVLDPGVRIFPDLVCQNHLIILFFI